LQRVRLTWPGLVLAFLAFMIWKVGLGDGMRGHELDDTQIGLLFLCCAFCSIAGVWFGLVVGRSDPNRS